MSIELLSSLLPPPLRGLPYGSAGPGGRRGGRWPRCRISPQFWTAVQSLLSRIVQSASRFSGLMHMGRVRPWPCTRSVAHDVFHSEWTGSRQNLVRNHSPLHKYRPLWITGSAQDRISLGESILGPCGVSFLRVSTPPDTGGRPSGKMSESRSRRDTRGGIPFAIGIFYYGGS